MYCTSFSKHNFTFLQGKNPYLMTLLSTNENRLLHFFFVTSEIWRICERLLTSQMSVANALAHLYGTVPPRFGFVFDFFWWKQVENVTQLRSVQTPAFSWPDIIDLHLLWFNLENSSLSNLARRNNLYRIWSYGDENLAITAVAVFKKYPSVKNLATELLSLSFFLENWDILPSTS